MNGSALINYVGVRESASQLRASSTKMNVILDKVKELMKSVNSEGTWQSDSAAQLKTQFDSLAAKFDSFYQAIEGYSKFLEATANAWEENDKKIASVGGELKS